MHCLITIWHMKVVIPTTYYRRKKWPFLVFLSPRSQFEVPDQNIWGKPTSDNPFHVPNIKLLSGIACGQHSLTKVSKLKKIATSQQQIFTSLATLVNACWAHAIPDSNLILGTWKGLSEVVFPQIFWLGTSNWFRGLRKTRKGHFFSVCSIMME